MALPAALLLWLALLLLPSAAPKPTCDPSACPPCPEGDPEVTATPGVTGCCPPCPLPCSCPPYLESDCEMQGFPGGRVPAGRSFYIDFARRLCTCGPGGDIACSPLCPRPEPACRALGSPVADGCPRCVCYDPEGMAVPAGSSVRRGSRECRCPALGGELLCGEPGTEE
ncbi:fibulin-2-like [Haemorhous mexicanus]|uniref:fibulin-2-like n=1 Tax=Haemorhous mexicanus TaxID=30427 RepID=UPI0028BD23D8|nr:fibulin-2-like [Haemorhous mexicanus]